MLRRVIYHIVIILILVMIGASIIKANKTRPSVLKGSLDSIKERSGLNPKEAKYYMVIEE